jgi:hypothetical protein
MSVLILTCTGGLLEGLSNGLSSVYTLLKFHAPGIQYERGMNRRVGVHDRVWKQDEEYCHCIDKVTPEASESWEHVPCIILDRRVDGD